MIHARTLLGSLAVGAVIAATAAGVGTLYAATGPVQGTAHADPAPVTACWVEKVHSVATAEVICGDTSKRPATGTADIGQEFGPAAHRWVAVIEGDGTADILPVSFN